MSYEFYQTLHIFGLFLLFSSLGAAAMHAMNGGTKESNKARKWVAITHGVSLLLVLVAGFGMLAKSGRAPTDQWPDFIPMKLAVWFVLGGALVLFYRKPEWAKALWIVLPALGGLVAAMVFGLI
jgi:uncharacterized membrane protein SirB2